jgi:hypothetical protein
MNPNGLPERIDYRGWAMQMRTGTEKVYAFLGGVLGLGLVIALIGILLNSLGLIQ